MIKILSSLLILVTFTSAGFIPLIDNSAAIYGGGIFNGVVAKNTFPLVQKPQVASPVSYSPGLVAATPAFLSAGNVNLYAPFFTASAPTFPFIQNIPPTSSAEIKGPQGTQVAAAISYSPSQVAVPQTFLAAGTGNFNTPVFLAPTTTFPVSQKVQADSQNTSTTSSTGVKVSQELQVNAPISYSTTQAVTAPVALPAGNANSYVPVFTASTGTFPFTTGFPLSTDSYSIAGSSVPSGAVLTSLPTLNQILSQPLTATATALSHGNGNYVATAAGSAITGSPIFSSIGTLPYLQTGLINRNINNEVYALSDNNNESIKIESIKQ